MNHSDLNFYLLNRGILLSAKSVSFDSANSLVSVKFEDLDVHGNVDGGHTYKIIQKYKENLDDKEQFCKIEILTGIEDIFEQLASARNTSVQVKDKSIADLEKKFDFLKEVLKNEPYANEINYKEFGTKRIDIQDILSLLNLFNLDRYPNKSNKNSYPINSYSGKKVCTDLYIQAFDDEQNGKPNPYKKMKNIIPDIFRLYDEIEVHAGDFYKGDSNNIKRYGLVKGVSTHQDGRENYYSKFFHKKMKYISPNGFLIPILGSFRALLSEDKGGFYYWVKDPFEVLKNLGTTLVNSTVDISRQLGNNPNATGKSQTEWMNLYMCVRMFVLEN